MVGDRQLAREGFARIHQGSWRRVIVEAPAQRGHRVVYAEQVLGCGRAQRHDDLRADDADLPHQEWRAGIALVAFGSAIARRPALHDVGDVDLLALEAHGGDHVVEQLSGAPDERQALLVFVSARPFADEHQLGVRISGAEDDLLASQLGQLAALAVGADVVGDDLQQGSTIGTPSQWDDRRNGQPRRQRPRLRRFLRRRSGAISLRKRLAAIERTDAQLAIEVEALAQRGFGVGIESHPSRSMVRFYGTR